MPAPSILRHTPALACEVDARDYAGMTLFKRGADNVTLSASSALFWDLPAFLHGYGCSLVADLGSMLTVAWGLAGGSGTFTAGIDADDFVWVEHSSANFTFDADPGDAYGLTAADVGVSNGTGGYRITAALPYQRGLINGNGKLTVSHATATPVNVSIVTNGLWAQSVPTLLRSRGGEGDADDVWDGLTLEDADVDGPGVVGYWFVTPAGNVGCNHASGVTVPAAYNLGMAELLGWDGTESTSTVGGRKTTIGTHPSPLFLAPSRQLVALDEWVDDDVEVRRMADGSHATSALGPYRGYKFQARIDGRVGSTYDLEHHLRRFLALARPGRPMTVYPQWGDLGAVARGSIDMRRHRDIRTVIAGASTVVGYSTAYTVEEHARVAPTRCGGRLLVRRSSGDEQKRGVDYAGRTIAQYIDLAMSLDHDPSR